MTDHSESLDGVAIVGMSLRFPGATTVEAFWRNLCEGVESISFFPHDPAPPHITPEVWNHPNYVKAEPVLEQVDQFDAGFFGYTAREAEVLDPQQRLFLECAWEALERGGYDPERYSGSIGVYGGVFLSTYLINNLLPNRARLGPVGELLVRHGNDKDYLATRLSYKFNLTGPSVTVQTSCSTALVAVHMACQSLLAGECDMALAGGASVNVPQQSGYMYHEGGIESPDGHCRAFSAEARGTLFGSGVGVVLLKRLADAVADGDTVYAVIKGSAINNDGSGKVGYTAPSVSGQAAVITEALAVSGIDPATLGYVEAHGTGTQLGDPIEITALTQAFRGFTDARGFCALGAVKPNIGHLGAASGIAGLIKTALVLHHGLIPPTLHFERPNPAIDFAGSPFVVNTALRPWAPGDGPRRAAVSSFGMGGTNAHAVLEEAPASASAPAAHAWHVLPLSARSEAALEQAAANLAAHLRQHPEQALADVAYTLQVGRKAFAQRAAVVCAEAEDAAALLSTHPPQRFLTGTAAPNRPIAFMFPGQGSQYARMAAGLYETEPVFREQIDRCAALLRPLLRLDLRTLLYAAPAEAEQASARLRQTQLAQAALFVTEYALAQLWMAWGLQPQALIGHSIGEYVAACLAGVFSLEDALRLVVARGQLMETTPSGAMLSVHLPADQLEPLLAAPVSIAAINGPALCVLAGPEQEVAAVERRLAEQGVSTRRLHTSHAFHSTLMQPIIGAFVGQVQGVRLSAPSIPFVSNVTGTWISDAEATDPAYWGRQILQPVRFADGVRELIGLGDPILLEVGPQQTLSTFARQQTAELPGVTIVSSIRHPHDPQPDEAVLQQAVARLWVAGALIDWPALYGDELRLRVPLPTYPFERQRYWLDPPAHLAQTPSAQTHGAAALARSWKRARLLPALAPGGSAEVWLVVGARHGLGAAIASELAAKGQIAVMVDSADDPALLDELRAQGRYPRQVILLAGQEQPAAPARRFAEAADLLVALADTRQNDQPQVTVVTALAQRVVGDEQLRPEQALAAGVCLLWQQRGDACRCVDVVPAPAGSRAEQALAAQIVAEAASAGTERLAAYRHGQRWVGLNEPLALDEAGPTPLREGGRYLLLGGQSHLGRLCAEQIAHIPQASLVEPAGSDRRHIQAALSQAERIDGVIVALEAHGDVTQASATLTDLAALLTGRTLDFCLLLSPRPAAPRAPEAPLQAALASLADAWAEAQRQIDATPWLSLGWSDWPSEAEQAAAPDWSPDGQRLALGLALGLAAGLAQLSLPSGGERARSPAASTSASQRRRGEAPRSTLEAELATIWLDVLGGGSVGIHDNFFELGGHSLLASQMITQIRERLRLDLPVRALFEAPTIAELAARIGQAQPASDKRLEHIPLAPRDQPIPLSFGQQRLWFLEQLEPESGLYNIPVVVSLEGQLDQNALRASLDAIIARHESLRTAIVVREGQPVQVISPAAPLELPLIDLRGLTLAPQQAALRRRIADLIHTPFDLTQGQLIRAALLRLDTQTHVLAICIHHIVADGWSLNILVRELSALYGAQRAGRPAELPALAVQYADYAAWQRQWLQGQVLETQRSYWRAQLAGAPVLELPTDRPRPAQQTFTGAHRTFELGLPLTEALKEVSRAAEVSLFMTLLGAFAALLAKYSGQNDLLIGTPIATRSRSELEGLIGQFTNTLVLRVDTAGNPSFRALQSRVREVALGAYAHQDMPFEQIVLDLNLERDLSRHPLFQVMFILQNALERDLEIPGLTMRLSEFDRRTARYDLTLSMLETPQGLIGALEYNSDLFDAATVDMILGHWRTLLTTVAADPRQRLAELAYLTQAEQQTFAAWNAATEADYPADRCVQHLFELQATRTPDAPAARFGEQRLTYRQLNQRANQLAHYLRQCGVQPGVLVGVFVERSLDMLVGVLGILKAGGAYVPLDPTYPPQRLAFMAQDAELRVMLTQQALLASLPPSPAQVVCLDRDWDQIARLPADNPREPLGTVNLAYVIYTSGSTGTPKGVQIPHVALTNFLVSMQQQIAVSPRDVLLAVTTLSFDIAGLELYLPLISGAQVVIASREDATDAAALQALLARVGASLLQATPATYRLLLTAGWPGQPGLRLLCGGEAVPRELTKQLLATSIAALWNVYGPTETTIWSTLARVGRGGGPVPIGVPIANTQLYVLDAQGQRVPVGVPGELYIGGDGLALGYLKRPDLTADRFVPDPFSPRPGARMYRTGDLVRFRHDQNVEYIRRVDHQVKLRGHRIELGEVESALRQIPGVREAVAIVREDTPGDQRLVGYLVATPEQTLAGDELRQALRQRLPDYMLPSSLVTLDALPLTPNGKIDRRALPAPDYASRAAERPFVAPSTPTEQRLAPIWAEVLGLPQVSANDDFFEAGGHSLLVTQLLFKVRDAFQIDLPLRALFEAPTIAGLGRLIDARDDAPAGAAGPMTLARLRAEVTLDPQVRGAAAQPPAAPRGRVLLTGVTGFLGAFLLDQLLKQTDASVACLVRARSAAEAMDRIRGSMRQYLLWNPAMEARIVAVPGDLEQPLLGMSAQQFAELAGQIDAIYHNGANVNFIYPYEVARAANVEGTRTILRLACEQHLKPVYFVSTYSTLPLYQRAAQGTPEAEQEPITYTGYVQSKWVAEQIVLLARARGLPVSILRAGRISGDSQTGACQTNDFLWRMIKACIQVGQTPALDLAVDMAPVDRVAHAVVELAQAPGTLGRDFNLVHPEPVQMDTLSRWIGEFGYPLERVSYDTWLGTLTAQAQASADNAAYTLIPFLRGSAGALAESFHGPADGAAAEQTDTAPATATAGMFPPIDEGLIATYLDYFVRTGYLDTPQAQLIQE